MYVRSCWTHNLEKLMMIMIFMFILLFSYGSSKLQVSGTASTTLNCFDRPSSNGFSCGHGTFMQYPFWPTEADGDGDQICGYPGFGYSCSADDGGRSPTLSISNDIYYVNDLDTTSKRLQIVNRDFLFYGDSRCPRPRRNFTLDHDQHRASRLSQDLNFNTNLNIFYNCSIAPPVGSYNITNNSTHHLACLDYNRTQQLRSYAFFDAEIHDQENSEPALLSNWSNYGPHYCNEIVVVPVLKRSLTKSDYLEVLQYGFQLYWSMPPDDYKCRNCEFYKGLCIYSRNGGFLNCSCPLGTQLYRPSHGDISCFPISQPPHEPPTHANMVLGIEVSAVLGGLIILTAVILFISLKIQRKRRDAASSTLNVELFLKSYGCLSLQRYKYSQIKKITNSFTEKLGHGGFGTVYKGMLADGRYVAVKVLVNDPAKKTSGEDFINEVATIGRTNHVNIVALIGFCSSGTRRALVYEFMANGSLEKLIYTKNKTDTDTDAAGIIVDNGAKRLLGWEKLYQISLGIARGLEYLHRGCNTRILHFDIKPHNILLDENFCPKISDFGLAKLCPTRDSIVSMLTGGRGTIGYIAPEVTCRNLGRVSHKSDVYSYGMMVFEMVGGRKNIDPFVDNTSEIYFPHWIYKRLEEQQDKIEDLLKFQEVVEEEMARKMIMVGLWCIQTNPADRPSMSNVVDMLEGSIDNLRRPPKPFVESSSSYFPPPK